MRKAMTTMLGVYPLSQPPEEFMEKVLAEVASTLFAAKNR